MLISQLALDPAGGTGGSSVVEVLPFRNYGNDMLYSTAI
jgi:hypothetical protein